MPAPFARLEARVTVATYRHLANALADFAPPVGGPGAAVGGVAVIFDAAMALVDETTGALVDRPVLRLPAAAVPGLAVGWSVTVGSGVWRVRQAAAQGEGSELMLTLAKH